MKKINLNVDGYKIEAVEGQSLLEASLEAGIYIPHLCHHPDLTPEGGCKLCTVKIDGKPGLVQSCMTLVEEGMCVDTKTDKVKQLRMVALELMLASHPKDCTSCDKYLNCELQAIMQYMGVVHSRLHEVEKENTKLTASDQFIKREMNRCIQCGRCVRACEELRGIGALAFNKKDGETYIGIKDDKVLTETDCRFCGACVEVCPTGAIQDVKGIFSKDSPRYKALIPCKDTCPAHTDIPTYVRLTEQGQYSEAVSVIREKLTFPHALGYVCTHTCETGCKRSHLDDAVSIRAIKRFAVENDKAELWKSKCHKEPSNGKKVAVVGAGPSGMTGAYYLAKKGYEVTVLERQAKAGGMLTYGIPKYRLPQAVVDKEIETLKEMGMDLQVNTDVKSIDFLKSRGFDAVLIAVGTHQGKRPPQYKNDWINAYNAVDICRLSNQDKLSDLGDTVTVYGGGNVAFDAARSVKKKGVKNVRIVCLEPRDRMLADDEEVFSAIEEGIEILNSKTMLELEDSENRVNAIKLMDVISFEFGPTGLNMVTKEGSEKMLTTDAIIFATGQQPDIEDGFGVELFRGTFIKTDLDLQTSEAGIFAAGDAIYGTKSVVEAIESGRQAAILMDKYLGGDGLVEDVLYERVALEPSIGIIENFSNLKRYDHLQNPTEAYNEGIRCLQCDLRLDIQKVKYWVDPQFKMVKVVES